MSILDTTVGLRMAIALCAAIPAASRADVARYGAWCSSRIGGGGYLQHVSFSPCDPDRLYMATDVGGCYRSDDGGASWTMLHGALPSGDESSYQIRGVLAHPAKKDTFLVAAGSAWGSEAGVYRSDDAGKSFKLVLKGRFEGNDDTRGDGFVVVRHPDSAEAVIASPAGAGPQRSDDFGLTWRSLGLEDVYARDMVVDRADGRNIWIIADDRGDRMISGRVQRKGFFFTSDGGATWTDLKPAEMPREMVQDPVDAGLLHGVFRSQPQLRRSRDRGRTWEPYSDIAEFPAPSGPRSDGTCAAICAGPDFVLAASHGGRIRRLECGTDSWRRLPRATIFEGDWYAALTQPVERHFGSALGFIAVSPHNPRHWVFTDWYACYRSPDAGSSWRLSIEGVEMAVVHVLAQDASRPNRIHAGMADIGYFRSDDAGGRFGCWGRHTGISNNVKSISPCAGSPDRVWATGPQTWLWHANQTFVSDDGGSTWRRPAQKGLPDMSDSGGARCNTVAAHPANLGEAYLAVSGKVGPKAGGVYRTDDSGANWTWIGEGLPEGEGFFRSDIWTTGAEIAVSPDGSLLAASHDGGRLFARPVGSSSWAEVNLPGRSWEVASDRFVPGRFYVSRRDAGLYVSDDAGLNWKKVSEKAAFAVAVDAAVRGRIAFHGYDSVFVSGDDGKSWRDIGAGLPYRHHRNTLCFAGDRIAVGTGGSGVFTSKIN